jgi:superkiller protein 3
VSFDRIARAVFLLTFFSRYLFLGFALDKDSKLQESEHAYDAATKLKPTEPQAWQGLIKLFEKQGDRKVEAYREAALRLAEIYGAADEKYKCQDVIDKFMAFAQAQGTRRQQREALEILLPSSPAYNYLEGRIPHPSHTYQKLIQIIEADEKERMNKEIGERRTRLGAKIVQVTYEVQRETLQDSPLEDLYSKIIDWSNDDELRRHYEEKLLQYCYDALTLVPLAEKPERRRKVEKLARDMVIIKHPYKLAWDITIEWTDHSSVEQWDVGILSDYCSFFSGAGLAKVLEAYSSSEISPFPALSSTEAPSQPAMNGAEESSEDEDTGGGVVISVTTEDRLILLAEGFQDAANSVLAHRLVGEYYAFLDEHESVVEYMRAGRRLIARESEKTGVKFEHASEAMTAMLGTALVFYQSPRNHPEAKALFEEVLERNPTSTPALIGTGLIFEEEEDYPTALDALRKALQRDPDNVRVEAEAAWVKGLMGDYEGAKDELEGCLPRMKGGDLRTRDMRAQTQYRIGVCTWNIDTSVKARKSRSGAYAYWLAALKSNLNYAPVYTSLGVFYSDYAKDKKRARKCFQKAFELSPVEVEAAERLARGFANDSAWEFVEAVAQRVVDSGKVRPAPGSKRKGVSWPFAALGTAELNKQEYAKAIASFQAALRIAPNDYHSWVGLGESYHNSGRYVAATKAFTHAQQFETEVEQMQGGETWFAKYMLANVKRELGQYDESINAYRSVLSIRPNEYGISIALIQTLVETAWDCADKGLFGQAIDHAKSAIETANDIVGSYPDAFNLWKSVADAVSVYLWVQGKTEDCPVELIHTMLRAVDGKDVFAIFSDVDRITLDALDSGEPNGGDDQSSSDLTVHIRLPILCFKVAVHSAARDVHAQAVAYYNLGWAEYRAHASLGSTKKGSSNYLKAAIRCFKRAIELEAGNAEFWNALGVVTTTVAPKIAQHSFVRSLYLNERSAQTWANLGALYLLQNDLDLAHEAFTRGQSADPAFAPAWVGQGLVSQLSGDEREARQLFTHAIEIADSPSPLMMRQYAVSTFDHILSGTGSFTIAQMIHPIFALNQLQSLVKDNVPYQHLTGLFTERIHDLSASLEHLSSVCARIEADYEVTESPALLSSFALAKADLARCQLAAGLYSDAIGNGETALDLSADDGGNDLSKEARQKARLSAHMTVGIAKYHLQNMAGAAEALSACIEESDNNPDAVCLLAQILWASNASGSRDKARDLLFDCVERHPNHVQSTLLLGAIAILEGDTESLDAVTGDLEALRTSGKVSVHDKAMIGEILRAAAALSGDESSLAEVQSEVVLFPNQPHGWGRLAGLTGDEHAAQMAVETATRNVPPKGDLGGQDLAEALAGTGKVADAQRAVMVAPWKGAGWRTLADVVVQEV